MVEGRWARHLGLAAVGFGLIGAVIYYVMITVTLAQIEAISGHVPFDMRPMGYGHQDATTLLQSLGVNGRSYYLTRQIPLDTAYPALLALTLISAMHWFGQSMPANRLVRVGVTVSVGAAICDYGENLGIFVMIMRWPDISTSLVYVSSVATVAKSILTTAAVTLLMVIGGLATWHRVQRVP